MLFLFFRNMADTVSTLLSTNTANVQCKNGEDSIAQCTSSSYSMRSTPGVELAEMTENRSSFFQGLSWSLEGSKDVNPSLKECGSDLRHMLYPGS